MDVTKTHVFCFKFQNAKCVVVEAVSAFNLLQIAIESFTAGQTQNIILSQMIICFAAFYT